MEKILYKSKASLLKTPVEVRTIKGITYAVIEAEEEHKVWGEKLFPGDDRDYEVQKHPVEVVWEISHAELGEKLEQINQMDSPLILFTFEGVKPRILLDVKVIKGDAHEQLEKNLVIFPHNPTEEREKRIAKEEQWLLNIDPKIWSHGG